MLKAKAFLCCHLKMYYWIGYFFLNGWKIIFCNYIFISDALFIEASNTKLQIAQIYMRRTDHFVSLYIVQSSSYTINGGCSLRIFI